jgi:hypothetical protein
MFALILVSAPAVTGFVSTVSMEAGRPDLIQIVLQDGKVHYFLIVTSNPRAISPSPTQQQGDGNTDLCHGFRKIHTTRRIRGRRAVEMCHGWRSDPDGAHAAEDSTRSITSLRTG